MRKSVLIIKLGWSETLDAEVSYISSLGDVLRTTVILHEYPGAQVTWLVDAKARQLIEGNPHIHRIVEYTEESAEALLDECFDVLINFEKVPEICALAHRISAERRFGFGYDAISGGAISLDGCERAYTLCKNPEEKRWHAESWQKILLEAIGGEWKGQEYILGYQPRGREEFDFGLNYVVGSKWPTKSWPKAYWEALARMLEEQGFRVSWQQGLADLNEYMDWIHSCRNIITCDSLGFHLALALKKKTVVIYGPTNSNETFLYGRGISLKPEGFPCVPCLKPVCGNDRFCLDSISPDRVFRAAQALVSEPAPAFASRSG